MLYDYRKSHITREINVVYIEYLRIHLDCISKKGGYVYFCYSTSTYLKISQKVIFEKSNKYVNKRSMTVIFGPKSD